MGNYFGHTGNASTNDDIELQSSVTVSDQNIMTKCDCVGAPQKCLHRAIKDKNIEYVS